MHRPGVRRILRSGEEASRTGRQGLRGREVPGVEEEGGKGQITQHLMCPGKEVGFILHNMIEGPLWLLWKTDFRHQAWGTRKSPGRLIY